MWMPLGKARLGDGRLTALVLSGALVAVAPPSFAQIPSTAPGGGQPVSALPPPAYPEWTVQRAIRTRSEGQHKPLGLGVTIVAPNNR